MAPPMMEPNAIVRRVSRAEFILCGFACCRSLLVPGAAIEVDLSRGGPCSDVEISRSRPSRSELFPGPRDPPAVRPPSAWHDRGERLLASKSRQLRAGKRPADHRAGSSCGTRGTGRSRTSLVAAGPELIRPNDSIGRERCGRSGDGENERCEQRGRRRGEQGPRTGPAGRGDDISQPDPIKGLTLIPEEPYPYPLASPERRSPCEAR